ncbi:MAG: hypothetical protein GEV12_04615 [Micromonosporaceae bacterium]|nr:hypothetical protein [Micromonosporaceae bacterium]
MGVAALVTWLVTAVGGFAMLGIWLTRGGHRTGGDSRLAPGLLFSHAALAAAGLVVWIVYLIAGGDALAWVAFVLLLPVALLGFTMFGRWLSSRHTTAVESRFPVTIVLGHGVLAATTLVLVLLTAAGVG